MENHAPAVVAVEVDAMADAATVIRDNEKYQRICQEKEQILLQLRKRGFRVTKQRAVILDIILEHECTSCKEIYYQAVRRDAGIGMATVYRMVNTLTDIGVLKVASLKPECTTCGPGNGCQILLKNQHQIVFNQSEWLEILHGALRSKGCSSDEEIVKVLIQ
jgi:Fur family ferric uptake transcriptional regulator